MSQNEKLILSILNNKKSVRFSDACRAATLLGFIRKTRSGTSHNAFSRPGEPKLLNFQERSNGLIAPYQAQQLIEMIEKYWNNGNE